MYHDRAKTKILRMARKKNGAVSLLSGLLFIFPRISDVDFHNHNLTYHGPFDNKAKEE